MMQARRSAFLEYVNALLVKLGIQFALLRVYLRQVWILGAEA